MQGHTDRDRAGPDRERTAGGGDWKRVGAIFSGWVILITCLCVIAACLKFLLWGV